MRLRSFISGKVMRRERALPEGVDAIGDENADQTGAALETLITDIGYTIGNKDVGNTLVEKGVNSNAGDKIAVGGAGNNDIVVRTAVASDGNRTVVCNERELSLNRVYKAKQGQYQQKRVEKFPFNYIGNVIKV
jgi:hypothetical protein